MTSEVRDRALDTAGLPEGSDGGAGAATVGGERTRGDELRIEVAPHNCFACGQLNEHGLHLDLHVDGDRCWTDLRLDDRFQGWDGIAHGGIVCTILDEVMAWSLASTDNWGVTARMSVAFRKPVVIGRTIRGTGWIESRNRRVIATAGTIIDVDSGEVLATADGTYVAADAERKRQLQARYRFRLAGPIEEHG